MKRWNERETHDKHTEKIRGRKSHTTEKKNKVEGRGGQKGGSIKTGLGARIWLGSDAGEDFDRKPN